MPAHDGSDSKKAPGNWLLAAGLGVAAVALAFLLNSGKRAPKRKKDEGESLDAGLRQPLPEPPQSYPFYEWTPVTGLVASAVGGSFALYGFRALRQRPNSDSGVAVRRYLVKSVGLRSTGR